MDTLARLEVTDDDADTLRSLCWRASAPERGADLMALTPDSNTVEGRGPLNASRKSVVVRSLLAGAVPLLRLVLGYFPNAPTELVTFGSWSTIALSGAAAGLMLSVAGCRWLLTRVGGHIGRSRRRDANKVIGRAGLAGEWVAALSAVAAVVSGIIIDRASVLTATLLFVAVIVWLVASLSNIDRLAREARRRQLPNSPERLWVSAKNAWRPAARVEEIHSGVLAGEQQLTALHRAIGYLIGNGITLSGVVLLPIWMLTSAAAAETTSAVKPSPPPVQTDAVDDVGQPDRAGDPVEHRTGGTAGTAGTADEGRNDGAEAREGEVEDYFRPCPRSAGWSAPGDASPAWAITGVLNDGELVEVPTAYALMFAIGDRPGASGAGCLTAGVVLSDEYDEVHYQLAFLPGNERGEGRPDGVVLSSRTRRPVVFFWQAARYVAAELTAGRTVGGDGRARIGRGDIQLVTSHAGTVTFIRNSFSDYTMLDPAATEAWLAAMNESRVWLWPSGGIPLGGHDFTKPVAEPGELRWVLTPHGSGTPVAEIVRSGSEVVVEHSDGRSNVVRTVPRSHDREELSAKYDPPPEYSGG